MDHMEVKKSRHNVLSHSEANVIRRNRIEKKYLKDKISYIEKEGHYHYKNLVEKAMITKRSMNAIQFSTGSAFKTGSSKVNLHELANSNDKNIELLAKKYARDIAYTGIQSARLFMPAERLRETNKSQSFSSIFRDHTSISELSKKANSDDSKRSSALYDESLLTLKLIEKYVDYDSNPNKRFFLNNNGAMKTILSRNDLNVKQVSKISSDYVAFKEKDVVEWNKYILNKAKGKSEYNPSTREFVFHDKEMYKLYKELCFKRDSIPPIQDTRIESLRKIDPVFTKRYRQYVYARDCGNKAVRFDSRDTFIPPFVPKFTIVKKQHAIIEENSNKKKVNKRPNMEMELLREKTKLFVNSLNDNDENESR